MRPSFALRWVLLVAVLGALVPCAALAQIPQEQRDALIELYNATGGPNWTQDDYWLGPPGTEATWWGVMVDLSQNTVIRLGLPNNHLTGQIPEIWDQLPDLQYLDLSSNDLEGPLPATLGKCWAVDTAYFAGNRLLGPIPAEWSDLRFLRFLTLNDNRFEGPLPSFLGSLPKLVDLKIDNNAFWGPFPRTFVENDHHIYLNATRNALRTKDPRIRYYLDWNLAFQVPTPENPKAEAEDTGDVRISWSLNGGGSLVSSMRVYQAWAKDGPYELVGELPGSDTSLSVEALPPGSPVFFRVRAYEGGAWTNAMPIETEPGPVLEVIPAGPLHVEALAAPLVAPLLTPVSFQAAVTDGVGPISFTWDFGDGAGDTGPSSTHQYAEPGDYTVTMTATDSMGARATAAIMVTAYPLPSVQAASEPDQQTGKFNFYVQAQDGAPPYTYLWDFGDGGTSTLEIWVNHTYGAPGEYLWTVTVTDSLGNTANASGTVDYALPPQVAASALPNWGAVPLTVEFRAQAIGGEEPLLIEWDFGDDTPTVQGEQVSHTYNQAWMYTWRVRVRDAKGRESVATGKIYAGLPRVTSASAGGSPFTLKVGGEGFSQGCTIYINGQQAPKTTFKSSTQLIAKGSGLASMLPRDETAVIQVRDPSSGLLCAPYRYYREHAPLPGKSPSRAAVSP
ncbi:MAG: PKD domain-containing protein [Acidobacteriota bacterium]